MLTQSDKELDRLSREAAEQYEPDETISSWEKLEARLDAELGKSPAPPTRRFGRGPIGYSALILLITGASYFLYKQERNIHSNLPVAKSNNKSITKKTGVDGAESKTDNIKTKDYDVPTGNAEKNITAEPNQEKKQPAEGEIPVSGTSNAKENELKPGVNTANKNDPGTNSKSKILSEADGSKAAINVNKSDNNRKPAPGKMIPGIGASAYAIGNTQSKNNATGNTTGKSNLGTSFAAATATGKNTAGNSNAKNFSMNTGTVRTDREANLAKTGDIVSITNHPPVVGGSLQVDPLSGIGLSSSLSGPISNKSAGKSRSLHLNRPLTIGILVAPDITMVNGIAPDRMSGNIGITLGYQITNRLSINSGFISTKKNYSAKGTDFKLPPTVTVIPDYVKGDCNMYEIPLTLRYNFDAGEKTYFFVNGGLSSYLMTHQSYVFYKKYSGPSGSWNYATEPRPSDTSMNYIFSVISLSAGIEHSIGKSFSVQIEPFVKIPLTGLGIGNLNLSSYGVSFSLRYAPLLSKSRH